MERASGIVCRNRVVIALEERGGSEVKEKGGQSEELTVFWLWAGRLQMSRRPDEKKQRKSAAICVEGEVKYISLDA